MATGAVSQHEFATPAALRRGIRVRFAQVGIQVVITGALMFLCAGSATWWQGWLYLATMVGSIVALGVYVFPRSPETIAARGRVHRNTATFDKVLVPVYSLCSGAIHVVGALDSGRFAWAPLGWPWSLVGVGLLWLATVPIAGAMAANRNLETTVRIQVERGHEVATTGPYRVVRHPMYVGALLQLPGTALLLGSTWALAPAAMACLLVVLRTALEDRVLQRHLPGYAAYTQRTRFRLVPGLW